MPNVGLSKNEFIEWVANIGEVPAGWTGYGHPLAVWLNEEPFWKAQIISDREVLNHKNGVTYSLPAWCATFNHTLCELWGKYVIGDTLIYMVNDEYEPDDDDDYNYDFD